MYYNIKIYSLKSTLVLILVRSYTNQFTTETFISNTINQASILFKKILTYKLKIGFRTNYDYDRFIGTFCIQMRTIEGIGLDFLYIEIQLTDIWKKTRSNCKNKNHFTIILLVHCN